MRGKRGPGPLRLGMALAALLGAVSPGLGAAGTGEPERSDATAQGPQTVAEASGFTATATHGEVTAFLEQVAAASPYAALDSLGRSGEGRDIPLLWVADPPDPGAAANRDKARVVLLGAIHGGEVAGKEALMMLARELAAGGRPEILDKVVAAFVPVYNPDGNDRMAPDNRPGQVGPEQGMGERANAQGLDLNRDFVKAEAPETRALLRLLRRWDPWLLVDTHTTNGSKHGYALTFEGPKHPLTPPSILAYLNDTMLPSLAERLEAETGYRSFFYGNFDEGRTRWSTYPDLPRYGVPYMGLRNRLGILVEAYAYAPYRDRVLATLAFTRATLAHVAERRDALRDLLKKAENESRAMTDIVLRSEPRPREAKARIVLPGDEGTVEVEHWDRFEAVATAPRPAGYVLREPPEAMITLLQRHGIEVEALREALRTSWRTARVTVVDEAPRAYQGHRLRRVEVEDAVAEVPVGPGDRVVRTGQALGTLAAYLLEPAAADGLAAWGLMPVAAGEPAPVLRWDGPRPVLSRALPPLPEDEPRGRRVDLDALYGPGRASFHGPPVSGLTWMPGGGRLVRRAEDRWWAVDAATGAAAPLFDAEGAARLLHERAGLEEDKALKAVASPGLSFTPDFSWAWFGEGDDLYAFRLDLGDARRLTHTPDAGEELVTASPDGARLAFVRGFDLYAVDLASGRERRLTRGGGDTLRHGKASWVYFEEIFNRDWKAYWWSPDSRRIAFLEFDDAEVPRFTLVDDVPEPQKIEEAAFPKPGRPNPKVRLGVVEASGGPVRWVGTGELLTGVYWSPDGKTLLYYAQNRTQTWLDVMAYRKGRTRKLFRETTGAWVSNRMEPHFLDDARFLLALERDGWRHLYEFDLEGTERGRWTEGPWEVRGVHRVDGGTVYVTASRDSHLAEALYAVERGRPPRRITRDAGHHRIVMAPQGPFFLDTVSRLDAPPAVRLRRLDGSVVRVVDANPVFDLERYRTAPYAFVTVPTRDGGFLQGTILKPPDFDPARAYPVWFVTYGGPHAPRVRDAWPRGFGWEQLLAAHGIVVFRADPRSASGRGAVSAWRAYRRLGVPEVEDVEDALRWIGRQSWADASRIGMGGGSYGGFMTLMALTRTTLLRAGVALAPVTDWRDYDSIYTERYMGLPGENAEGYDATSIVKRAADLHGRLLLMHGAMDDNVHLQHSVRLMQALQKAGIPFEFMLYPQARHRIRGRHRAEQMLEFILRELDPSR